MRGEGGREGSDDDTAARGRLSSVRTTTVTPVFVPPRSAVCEGKSATPTFSPPWTHIRNTVGSFSPWNSFPAH